MYTYARLHMTYVVDIVIRLGFCMSMFFKVRLGKTNKDGQILEKGAAVAFRSPSVFTTM